MDPITLAIYLAATVVVRTLFINPSMQKDDAEDDWPLPPIGGLLFLCTYIAIDVSTASTDQWCRPTHWCDLAA